MAGKPRVLVVADAETASRLRAQLRPSFTVAATDSLDRAGSREVAAVLLDEDYARHRSIEEVRHALEQMAGAPALLVARSADPAAQALAEALDLGEPVCIEEDAAPVVEAVSQTIQQHRLERENILLKHVVETTPDCVVAAGGDGRVALVNDATLDTFGYSRDEIGRRHIRRLFPGGGRVGDNNELHAALESRNAWAGRSVARRRDGSRLKMHVTLSFPESPAAGGRPAVLVARNETDLELVVDRLKQLAIIDELTGAYNVRYFWARLRYEVLRSRRYDQPLALLMADLDRFKSINDEHGHRVGDAVLAQVCEIIRSVTREVDVLCRYGGEEFAVILPSTPLAGAQQCAENVRRAVERRTIRADDARLRVSISLGVCTLGPEVESEETLLRRADRALLRAKQEGRNRFCVWDPATDIVETVERR